LQGSIKDEKTEMKILFYFMNSFLFTKFDEEEKKLLIDSMTLELTDPEQIVIKEGDFGECMYFVDEGSY
jgi:hypothetical protein